MNHLSHKFIMMSICISVMNIKCTEKITAASLHVAEFIKKYMPEKPVIFEAGSYDGSDTEVFAKFWPGSTVHAFEPVPEIFKSLKEKAEKLPNIKPYSVALTDKVGTAEFFISEFTWRPGLASGSGSLMTPHEHLEFDKTIIFPKKISVDTTTIDIWAKQNGVTYIDFMWLDMQGHELTALKSAKTILPTVKLIFTEVEFVEAYKDQPLYKELKDWLITQGFMILATDFDEAYAERKDIKPGESYMGNVLFINEKFYKAMNK